MRLGPRRLAWNADERRLRAPLRLVFAAVLFLAFGELLRQVAVWLARVGAPLGPGLEAIWVIVLATGGLAAAIGAVFALALGFDRRRIADLGVSLDLAWTTDALVGVLLGSAVATATVGVAVLAGAATVDGVLASWVGTFALTADHPLFDATFWLVVFLGAGALEEVLFRGYLLVNVAEGLRGPASSPSRAVLGGVVVAAGLFGVVHAANPGGSVIGVANIVLFGLLLGVAVAATGDLALAIGFHIAWNVMLGLGFGLPVSGIETGAAVVDVTLRGPDILTGGAFGPEGGLLGLVGVLVGVGGLGWVLARRGELSVDDTLAVPALRDE